MKKEIKVKLKFDTIEYDDEVETEEEAIVNYILGINDNYNFFEFEEKGCGKNACGVETISDTGEKDVDIITCGEYNPYHKRIEYCKECEGK
jgi:hypothetical protein